VVRVIKPICTGKEESLRRARVKGRGRDHIGSVELLPGSQTGLDTLSDLEHPKGVGPREADQPPVSTSPMEKPRPKRGSGLLRPPVSVASPCGHQV
jgi:hypothetical protein